MSKFSEFFTRLMGHEGGYSNNPSDPGGETMWGVTKAVARKYGYNGPMKQLPKATAEKIVDAMYWQAIDGEHLPPAIAWHVLDAAYNHGTGTSVKLLQRAVGTKDDGILGPKTIAAANQGDINDIIFLFCAERIEFYCNLNTFSVFGKGWMRRMEGNLRWAASDN